MILSEGRVWREGDLSEGDGAEVEEEGEEGEDGGRREDVVRERKDGMSRSRLGDERNRGDRVRNDAGDDMREEQCEEEEEGGGEGDMREDRIVSFHRSSKMIISSSSIRFLRRFESLTPL
jgi:hypothetical protein